MKCQIDMYAGLLGCGKTTLINRLLQTEYAGKKVAIIENEIGKVNLDAGTFQADDLTIRPMTGGCVCCTVKGDFTAAVERLVREVDPEYIVIEPTGAADIRGMIEACREPEHAEPRRLVMIVNARRLLPLLQVVGPFYKEQIETASCIYMNFTETMTEEAKREAETAIRRINPEALLIRIPVAEITADTFADAGFHQGSTEKGSLTKRKNRFPEIQSLDEEKRIRMQGIGKQRDVLYTWTMTQEHPFSEAEYREWKQCLADPAYGDLWRAKGIVSMENGEKRRLDLTFGDLYEREQEAAADEICGQLVLIGKRIERRKWMETFGGKKII
ncbi:MAG: GTP-binding protein [Eubacteriales bacterium]|nr:GTP-binding protein [Eubacteriales bacterium]